MNPHFETGGETAENLADKFNLVLALEDLRLGRALASDPAHVFPSSSRTQAENMARFSRVDLTPDEIRLYCALRGQASEPMGGRAPVKGEGGNQPSALSDQKLLAAILNESGDGERLRKFVSSYPNIFS